MSDNITLERIEKTLDKSAIRDFAVNARRKLKEKVELQANKMGFYSDGRVVQYEFEDDYQVKINGEFYPKAQIKILKEKFSKNFDSVIDEVAYTWFNRFIALYYMECHNYIENSLNIISSINDLNQTAIKAPNYFKNIDKEELFTSVQANDSDEVYKKLIIAQCNELNKKLPFLFEEISNYTELLFPSGMLNNDSMIREMLALDKSNWNQVEIIGWLYQYYITEVNALVYDGSFSKKRLSKELLPAATQLFTPKWAVQYMVDNSVGKLWLENYPNDDLQKKFKYYIDSINENSNIQFNENKIKPENIKVLDPACGSGHILVTAFEVLYEIYKSAGYLEDEIAEAILKNNLFGLDICDRAAQLAQLAVIMKAREYDKNIFSKIQELNITSIQDTNWIDSRVKECLMNGVENQHLAQSQIELLQTTFKDAKEYGSILDVKGFDFDFWEERLNAIQSLNMGLLYLDAVEVLQRKLPQIIKQIKIMQQQYETVITNPPYLGSSRMSTKLVEYVAKNFPKEKSDFCTIFYKKSLNDYLKPKGYLSFIMTTSWLFLKSFESLRKYVIGNFEFESLVDFGTELFDGKVGHNPIVAWVNKKTVPTKKLLAIRLVDFCYSRRNEKPKEFFNKKNYYISNQKEFLNIPGSPIAYWASDRVREIFANETPLGKIALVRNGMKTGNNDRFLRIWSEVDLNKFSTKIQSIEQLENKDIKWFPYNKGGEYRKWYGNNDYVVNWQFYGKEIFGNAKIDKRNVQDYPNEYKFKPSVSWSLISSGAPSFRLKTNNLTDIAGMSYWVLDDEKMLMYLLGLTNSTLANYILKLLAPTISYQSGNIATLPYIQTKNETIKQKIDNIVHQNIEISKDDWDSFETSWNFEQHPLLRFRQSCHPEFISGSNQQENLKQVQNNSYKVSDCFNKWKEYKEQQFNQLKTNEEELNRLFIEIYGLQDEMSPEVDEKDVTVAKADNKREIKSLLSYAVGCMLGRYSLDEEGLVFAGGTFDNTKYQTLEVDEDGILPVLGDTWFEDDIVEEFKRFLKVSFGELYFNENMQYIADVLGRKSGESAEDKIRNYFLKDFYKDHLQIYKKRPIYWMFTSGKEKAFNCLVYLHRYDKTTLSRIRKDYLHEFQAKLDRAIPQAEEEGNVKLTSLYAKYKKESQDFDAKIKDLADVQIELDLDDGVKVNYAKFKGLLEMEKDIIGKEK